MKGKCEDLGALEVRRDDLAEFLNVMPRRFNQLARCGRLPKPTRGRYPLKACVHAYIGQWQVGMVFDAEALEAELAMQRDFDIDTEALAAELNCP
jgi:hypothetical protein